MINGQIKALRQQLDKSSKNIEATPVNTYTSYRPEQAPERDIRALLDELSSSVERNDNNPRGIYTTMTDAPRPSSTSGYNDAHVRMLLDALSESTGSTRRASAVPSNKIYTAHIQGSADSLPMPGSMPRWGPSLGDGRSKYVTEMYKPLPPSP